jgi:hypothetical protein
MTDGAVIVIRGQVTSDLGIEKYIVNGGLEALVVHLDHAPEPVDPPAGLRKIRPIDRNVMNIRGEPKIGDNIIGKLDRETEAIEELIIAAGEVWVRIGFHQYVAMVYGGKLYCEYVD